MLKLSLKTILNKKNETALMIASIIERLNASVWIEDDKGNSLLGSRSETCKVEQVVIKVTGAQMRNGCAG